MPSFGSVSSSAVRIISSNVSGSQFTSFVWTDRMKRASTRISMDGKGRCMTFYNHHRPHAAHGGRPPAVVYWNQISPDRQDQKVA